MNRVELLRNQFEELKIEVILISGKANVCYLSGFMGDSSYLFVSKEECFLITDERYTEQAQKECHSGIQVLIWIDGERFGAKTYQHLLEKSKASTLGFESKNMTHAEYLINEKELKKFQLKPLEGVIENLRQIKDESEIKFLTEACTISDKTLELTIPFIKPEIKEVELAALLEYNLKISGADDISFKTIVLSGSRTSLLHGNPIDKTIENGDLVLIDFGAEYKGYHADMTRTFIAGKADNKQRELYNTIYIAQTEAVNILQNGISGNLPDKVIREIIPNDLLPYYYPGIGHGVGLEIHEQPFIKQHVDFTFKSGMVVTIEPGLYIPGWGGIRIEDTVLITENGVHPLTHFPKGLIEI